MPQAVTTEQLLHKVWADSDAADPAYVWVTVRRLRQKLEFDADHPLHLLTDPGGGYRLAAAELRPGVVWSAKPIAPRRPPPQ
jgi:DNA-binding response OmpR family regulator